MTFEKKKKNKSGRYIAQWYFFVADGAHVTVPMSLYAHFSLS